MKWTVPRMWEGETVAILASGPSMSQAVADRVRSSGVRSIAINTTFRLAPWADMLYAADGEWWAICGAEVDATFNGMRVGIARTAPKGVLGLNDTGMTGFDPDPSCVRTGGNSGYQAVHVAAHAGANRILLCGFDMRAGNQRREVTHWHGPHPKALRNGVGTYESWISAFTTLAPELKRRRIEVWNCTPLSGLTCFPKANLEQMLESCVPVS